MAWGLVFETVLSGGAYNLLDNLLFLQTWLVAWLGLALPQVFEP